MDPEAVKGAAALREIFEMFHRQAPRGSPSHLLRELWARYRGEPVESGPESEDGDGVAEEESVEDDEDDEDYDDFPDEEVLRVRPNGVLRPLVPSVRDGVSDYPHELIFPDLGTKLYLHHFPAPIHTGRGQTTRVVTSLTPLDAAVAGTLIGPEWMGLPLDPEVAAAQPLAQLLSLEEGLVDTELAALEPWQDERLTQLQEHLTGEILDVLWAEFRRFHGLPEPGWELGNPAGVRGLFLKEQHWASWSKISPTSRRDVLCLPEFDYVVDDSYCARAGCDCEETSIEFRRAGFADERAVVEIQIDRDGVWDLCDIDLLRGESSPAVLVELLFLRHPHLLERIAERRARVRELVPILSSPQVRRPLSQNGPCYCGSGKKYKSCHGRR